MKKIFLFFLTLLLSQSIIAQTYPYNYQVRGIDLPSEVIYGIEQDHEGLMWFNTALGVYFSDGFDTYSVPDTIKVNLSNYKGMFKDEEGNIWVYNKLGIPKVYRYFLGGWEKISLPKEVIEESFIYSRFDIAELSGEKWYFLIFKDFIYFSKNFKDWNRKDVVYENLGDYYSLFVDKGEIFLFFEKGTFQFRDQDIKPFIFKGIQLPDHISYVTYDDQKGKYYFLGRDFLASGSSFHEPDELIYSGFLKSNYSAQFFGKLELANGEVYFFLDSQLHKYNPESGRIIEISAFEQLKTHNIYSFLLDREGIIWVGSHRGVINFNSLKFFNYYSPTLLDDEVTALIKLNENEYLLGYNHGLQLWGENGFETLLVDEDLRGLPDKRVTNFSMDKNGIVWFSSNTLGLGRFDPKSRSLEMIKRPDVNFINSVQVHGDSLYITAGTRVFLSSIYKKGLKHFELEVSDKIQNLLGNRNIYIRKVFRDSLNRMILLVGGNSYADRERISVQENMVIVVGFDFLEVEGGFLVSTEEGLKIVENGVSREFTVNGESIGRQVYGLLRDSSGRIWAGTDQGVFMIFNNQIKQFDVKSGLAGSETNRAALIEGPQGKILIGTSKGLSILNMQEDKESVEPPILDITAINLINAPNVQIQLKKIPFSYNSLAIQYRAITFLQDVDLIVSYKLEGLHEDWVELVNPRTNVLTFNNLPPGDYQLFIKASIDGKVETNVLSSEKIRILKPLYLQTWFLILLLFVLIGIGFLIKTLQDQTKKAGVLKQEVDEKTQKANVSEDQFKNVWESSKDGLMIASAEGRIIAVNEAFSTLSGVPREELEHGFLGDVFKDSTFFASQKSKLEAEYAGYEGPSINFEISIPFKSGVREIDYYSSELKTTLDGVPLYLGVFRDVTEKKKYEEGLKFAKEKAEEASRMKSSFLSNMSHEIRTPLNGILGTTENIILQRKKDKELVSQLEIIQESGERLLNTINSILDLSKIESNKIDIKPVHTNINDFVAKIILPLKNLAVRKGLLISVKYETQPFVGMLDARYFEMIINNIVGNAIKYSNKGLITVKLSGKDENLLLEVVDQGIGMSEEFLERIFFPFEQESQGYGRNYEGTGLGLAITKNLIDALKGDIKIESVKEKGTKVLVILPIGKN